MTVTFGFYDSLAGDRKYNASQMSQILEGIINDGIMSSVGGALAVTHNTGTMNLTVASGRAWFNNTWTKNDASLTLTLDASDPVLNRIDIVILEVNSDTGVRANTIKILKGTSASSPSAPALSNTATLHQYALAEVYIGAGVTSITAGNITDKRGSVGTPMNANIQTQLSALDASIDVLTADVATLRTDVDTLQSSSGEWITVTGGWSYGSAVTVNVPTDATTKYQIGDRIRFKQGGGYKYFTVRSLTSTVLTFDTTNEYSVANTTITDIAYSRSVTPFGFPSSFTWTPTPGGHTVGNGSVIARFVRTGRWIDFQYSFTLGSTSAISGDFSISLPVYPNPDFESFADLGDIGSAAYMAFGIGSAGTGLLYIRAINVAGTYPTVSVTLASNVTHVWATGDTVRASGRYLS